MENLIASVQFDQLLTAGGFVSYLLYQNMQLHKLNSQLRKEKDELTSKYINSIHDQNKDSMEAIRTFDRLVNELRGK
jgi:hypothetical protein